jgi:hypothetical protein
MLGLCDPFPGNEQEQKFVEESNRAIRRKYALGEYALEYVCYGKEFLCLSNSRVRCRRCSLEARRAHVRAELAWLETVWAKEEQEIFPLVSEWKKRKREEEEEEEKEKEEEEAEKRKFREEEEEEERKFREEQERRWWIGGGGGPPQGEEEEEENSESGSDDTVPAQVTGFPAQVQSSPRPGPAQSESQTRVQSSPRPGPAQSESQARVLDQILDTPSPGPAQVQSRSRPVPVPVPPTPSTPEDIRRMVDGFNVRTPVTPPGCFGDPSPERPRTSVRRNWGLKRRS